jgi:hypothetical protein
MRLRKESAVIAILMFLSTSGCSKTMIVTAEELCQDWRHQTVSKHDKLTDGTATQIEASNKSRPNWGCRYGEPSS